MSDTRKAPKGAATTPSKSKGFTDFEKGAMKERARELKADSRREAAEADGEKDVLAKIGEMTGSDRDMAERLHALIKSSAPALASKTWYGMPAYARDDKIVCFFQPAKKFKTRYATLGFNDAASLDDGNMWPVAYALAKMTAADEKRISELLKKAAG